MEFMERGGMSTSTRNAMKKLWPYHLPNYDPEKLAKLVFCFENEPEKGGHISGAQDAIGICIPGLSRHYYDNHYWPEQIEMIHDEATLAWLEEHLCLIPTFPRPEGTSVVAGCKIDEQGVKALSSAADRCWTAILNHDLSAFAEAYQASFEAQIAMFPAMVTPEVQAYIEQYRDKALAWKLSGAGAGGYLALVVEAIPEEAIRLKIRRREL